MSNSIELVFVQDDSISSYPLIKHLLDNQTKLLKNYVSKITVIGQLGTSWQEEFVSLRLPLLNCEVDLEFENYVTPEIPKDKRVLILPLTDELSKAYSEKYLEEYSTQINNPNSHWRPTGTNARIISSFLPGYNDEVDMKSICKLDPSSSLIKSLNQIPKLNLSSIPIDCQIINKYSQDKSLFRDNAKLFINKALLNLESGVFAVRSLNKSFEAKFYINNNEYYNSFYSSKSSFRSLSSLIFDIKNYSIMHPEDTLFIQPYYKGTEIVVNYYQDDQGTPIITAFSLVDSNGGLKCCYDPNLEGICIAISRELKLKHFSFRTIRLSNDTYALIDLKYSFNKYLAATLKYQSDFLAYELTRGFLDENNRLKYLEGKYKKQYTDKIFNSILTF